MISADRTVSADVRPSSRNACSRLTGPPEAVNFDMGGVLTDTAEAHAAAWKHLFDAYLRERDERTSAEFEPFNDADYRTCVDKKPRCEGVKSFLETRSNALHVDPELPADLDEVRPKLRYRRHVLDVEVTHDALKLSSEPLTALPIPIACRDHYREMAPGEEYELIRLKTEDRDRDENRRTAPQIGNAERKAAS